MVFTKDVVFTFVIGLVHTCAVIYCSCSLKPWFDIISTGTCCRGRKSEAYNIVDTDSLLTSGVEALCYY